MVTYTCTLFYTYLLTYSTLSIIRACTRNYFHILEDHFFLFSENGKMVVTCTLNRCVLVLDSLEYSIGALVIFSQAFTLKELNVFGLIIKCEDFLYLSYNELLKGKDRRIICFFFIIRSIHKAEHPPGCLSN